MGLLKQAMLEENEKIEVPNWDKEEHYMEARNLILSLAQMANLDKYDDIVDLIEHHFSFVMDKPRCLRCTEEIPAGEYTPGSNLCGYCDHMMNKDD